MRISSRSIQFFLVAVVTFQMFLVISDYGWTWAKATIRTAHLPAMKRSSRFLFGNLGSDYIDFLSSVVPADKPVVKPEGSGEYAEQSLLQFFLLPRGITACPCQSAGDTSNACAACLLEPSHYVPALGGFPEAYLVENDKKLVEFPGISDWLVGVYVPQNADISRSPSPEPNTLVSWLLAGGRSLITYGLIYLAGLAVVSPFLYHEARGWALSVAFPIGSGLITWLVFLFAWLGMPLNAWTYLVAFTLLASSFIFWILRRARNGVRPSLQLGCYRPVLRAVKWNSLATFVIAALILLLGLSLIITIGRAYSIFDDIANWALKGYAIAYEGSIFAGFNRGGHALAYPQNLHLQIALFRFVDGDSLPGSKILFTLFFASLIAGCYIFWRQLSVRRSIALLGTLTLASVPTLFFHSTTGYANLPMSVYLVLGALLILDGARRDSLAKQVIGSVLLGLSAWTRLESALYALVLGIGLFLVARLILRARSKLWALFVPMFVIEMPWFFFYFQYGRTGAASSQATNLFFQQLSSLGSMQFTAVRLALQQITFQARDTASWGAAIPLFAVAVLIGLWRTRSSTDKVFLSSLFLVFVMYLAVLLVLHVAGFVASQEELEAFIRNRSDRHFFPVVILLIVTSILALGRMAESPLSITDRDTRNNTAGSP